MNKQEIFDTAVKGLASQGFKRSRTLSPVTETTNCSYRGNYGEKCAIGWCIPDDVYTPDMDDSNSNTAVEYQFKILEYLNANYDEEVEFLTKLQNAHDYSSSPFNMKQRLREFAGLYKLIIPEEIVFTSPC